MSTNLKPGQRAERRTFITIAEWTEGSSDTPKRVILGKRVEDASMEFNADIEQTTDILGINYTDVNKTQPQMTFDPAYIIGGDDLMEYLYKAALRNDMSAFNNVFTVYQVAAFDGDKTNGYYTVKHENCSIIPTSLGGDAYLAMPFDVYFSNDITEGTINKLADDFEFTETQTVAG